MDDPIRDDCNSPDVARPRFLLRRYDSVSGCSESSSTSSSSRGSFLQSPGRTHDLNDRRTQPNTFNGFPQDREDLTVENREMKGNERSYAVTEDDDNCIFCDTLVNERQYYLWNSQYTKSSLCSRCSYDNDGMRYISYWGTPAYQSGSWRKRYNAGRGIDIDLTPLIEVLERIDQIDTSIYGRKYTSEKSNIISDKMTEKKRRRNTNGSEIGITNDINNNTEKNASRKNSFDVHLSITNKESTERYNTQSSTKLKAQEFHVSEICSGIDDVEVIEPIEVINISKHPQTETYLNDDESDSENLRASRQRKFSYALNSAGQQTLLEYRQQRRKSNYEEFLAGLEPLSQLKRRSTAAKDLSLYTISPRNNVSTETEIIPKDRRKYQHKNETKSLSEKSSKDFKVDTQNYKSVGKGQCNIMKTNESCHANKTIDFTSSSKSKHIRPLKFKYKRRNTPYIEESDIILSKQDPLSEYDGKSCHNSCEKKHNQVTNKVTEYSNGDNSTFADIKNIYENLSNGTKFFQTDESNLNQVSKGHFRSKYIKSAEAKSKLSDTGEEYDENENDNNGDHYDADSPQFRTLNEKQSMKRNENGQKSESDTECSESDFLDDNVVTDSHDKFNQQQNKLTENFVGRKVENERKHLTGGTNNINANDIVMFTENLYNRHECTSSDDTDIQKPKNAITDENGNENYKDKNKEMISSDLEIIRNDCSLSGSVEQLLREQKQEENSKICYKNSDDGILMSSRNTPQDAWDLTKSVINTKGSNRSVAARAREKKYRSSERDHENPHIARIKKKLSRKPKYENNDSDSSLSDEINDVITELNGSDNEEIELGWRSRGYNTDFYMSRRSVTGGEIIDRYKKAISNRRSKVNSRRSSKGKNISSKFDDIMTQPDAVSGSDCKPPRLASASLENACTYKNTDLIENVRDHRPSGYTEVSAFEIQAALDRAAHCSKRMSKRLKAQLSQQSDSYDSTS